MSRVTKICKDCKKPFDISFEEIEWLKTKSLEVYKRCPDCRKRRKEAALNDPRREEMVEV